MKFLIGILLVSSINLFAAEVSVFGAGDLNAPNPYGLTKVEEVTLNNTNELKRLGLRINNLKIEQDELKQNLEGIKSLFEGDSKLKNDLKTNTSNLNALVKELETRINNNNTKLNTLEKNQENIQTSIKNFTSLQNQNNQHLQDSIDKLNESIAKLSNQYATQKQFDELVAFVNNNILPKNDTKQIKSNTSNKSKTSERQLKDDKKETNFGYKDNADLFKNAVELYEKNYLTKSMPMFEKLIEDNYLKASSSYYLADILHKKKNYSDAIHYFKQSMMLNDQAEYIPKLLLDSADSFENTGDIQNAKNFYQTLIEAYGETDEANEAAKRLLKLNK